MTTAMTLCHFFLGRYVAEGLGVCLWGVVVEGVLAGDFQLGQLGKNPDEVFPGVELPPTAALDDGVQ